MSTDIEEKINFLYEMFKGQFPACMQTVSEWANEWMMTFKVVSLSSSSYERYCRTIKHIDRLFGPVRLSALDSVSIQKGLNTLPTAAMRDDCYAILYQMFEKAVSLSMVKSNPMRNVELKKHKKQHGKALDIEEEKRFVEACHSNKRGIAFLICLYAGLRRGEVLALERSDIDLEERKITVSKQFQNGIITAPKTEAGDRSVPILNCLYKELVGACLPEHGRIVPIKEHALREHFMNICKDAGLENQGFTIHSLRHTFVTRCAERGVPRHVTQYWAGHATPSTTTMVYTHMVQGFEAAQIERLNSLLDE